MQLCVSMAESYLEAARIRSPDRWRSARNSRHDIPFPSCRWPPLTGGRHTEKGDETDANSSNSSIPWRELRPQKHWLKMIKGWYGWKLREMLWMKSPWERRGDTPSPRMAPRRRIHEQLPFFIHTPFYIHLDLLLLAFQRNELLCSGFHFVIHLCQLLWSVPKEDVNGWYTSTESCSLIPSYLLHSVGGCEIIPIFICIASLILAYPMNICPFSSSFTSLMLACPMNDVIFSSVFTSLVLLCPTNVYPFSHFHRSGFVCCLQHPRWMRCFCYVFHLSSLSISAALIGTTDDKHPSGLVLLLSLSLFPYAPQVSVRACDCREKAMAAAMMLLDKLA